MEQHHVNQIILALMGKQGQGIPIRATEVSDANRWALDARNHTAPGQHLRATHSSGSPVLFSVTDAGVSLSIAGAVASNPFVYPNMIVEWDAAAGAIPAGWAICDGTSGTPDLRDRFTVGAGSTYAQGATGGSATVSLLHHHTSAAHAHSHTHSTPNHAHAHSHSFDHHHAFAHDHSYDIDHNHAGFKTTADDSANLTSGDRDRIDVQSGTDFFVSGGDHRHFVDAPNHDVANRDTGGPQNTSWSLANDTSGAGTDTDTALGSGSSGSGTSGSDATSTTPGDTGDSLSSTQSIIPPYYAVYKIRRMVA